MNSIIITIVVDGWCVFHLLESFVDTF